MGNRESSRRKGPRNHDGYHAPSYYRPNRSMGEADDERYRDDDERQYDDRNTGKVENFKGEGYYGSDYGTIAEWNRGRDYETNAGYRQSYDRLTTGQWPEVEHATRMRGIGPHEGARTSRGIHRGKGPRTYQRSDERIREDVNDVLYEDAYVDASEIEVEVKDGEVLLTGTVENKLQKRRAEDLLQDLRGIRHLENRLRVRKPGSPIVNINNA